MTMNFSDEPTHPLVRILSLAKTGPIAIIKRFIDQGYRKRTGFPLWGMSEVSPNLYLGGQHMPKGWAMMEDRGITAVVNMRESHYADHDTIRGQRHLHLATRDNTPPKVDDLIEGVKFISDEIENGGKVYVHCGVGVGRAPTMTAAYLVSQGMSPNEALAKIQSVRPFIHLTSKQRRVLDDFAKEWKKQ